MINKELLIELLKKSHKLNLEYKETLNIIHKYSKDNNELSFNDELVKNIREDYENKIKCYKIKTIDIFSNGIYEEKIKTTEKYDYEAITLILKNNIDEYLNILCLENNIDVEKFKTMLDIIDDKYEVYVDDSFEFFIYSSLNYNLKKERFLGKDDNGSVLIKILNFLTNNNIKINKETLIKVNEKTKIEIEEYENKFKEENNFYDINGEKLKSCPRDLEKYYNSYESNGNDIKIIKTKEISYYENNVVEEKEIDVLKYNYNNLVDIKDKIIEEFFKKWCDENNVSFNNLKQFLKVYSEDNNLVRNFYDFKEFITYGLEYDLIKDGFIYENKDSKIKKILKYALKEFKNVN